MFNILIAMIITTSTLIGFASPRVHPQPIAASVLLDGVLYSAEDFNAARAQGRWPRLHFALTDENTGVLHAFTSELSLRALLVNEAPQARSATSGGRLARPIERPVASHGCSGHENPPYSGFFTGYACSGEWLYARYETAHATLPAWMNNTISSVTCSLDLDTTWCAVWDGTYWTGEDLWIKAGSNIDNLGFYGFDNRISSIIVYGQSSLSLVANRELRHDQ